MMTAAAADDQDPPAAFWDPGGHVDGPATSSSRRSVVSIVRSSSNASFDADLIALSAARQFGLRLSLRPWHGAGLDVTCNPPMVPSTVAAAQMLLTCTRRR